MAKYHIPVSFGKGTDTILDTIEEAEPGESYKVLLSLKKSGRTEVQIISTLALSSAKWVDHSGPYIGHGILNADPILRAIGLMEGEDRDLAMLETVMYITDLLRHPNYGPYSMQEIESVKMDSEEQTRTEFSKAVRSGNSKHMAEKLLAGLYSSAGKRVSHYLLYEGLMQFGENEHRLLLPYHTLKLLDKGRNWNNAVYLMRPSVQYISTSPDISHGVKAEQLSKRLDFAAILRKGDVFNQENAYDLTRMLLNSAMGNEMTVLTEYGQKSSLPDIYEAIALTSTLLLLNSDLEQHSVTGKHCILSMISDKTLPEYLRSMALLTSLEGPRARRLKSYIQRYLDNYLKMELPAGQPDAETLLGTIEEEIRKGKEESAFKLAGSYIVSGLNPDRLTGKLLSICFRTEGPLESLHTSKMLVGMNDVTKSSRSDMKWLHLAAGAKFVAEMVKREKAESQKVHEQFRKYNEEYLKA